MKNPKLKSCPVCGEDFKQYKSTQKTCPKWQCALEYVRQKNKEKARKSERREIKQKKEELKSLSQVCAEQQRYVNQYIRARDEGKGCISCDSDRIDDAGHFFPIGSKYRTSRIRFDERLINGQCKKCNVFVGGGNREGYERGVVERYGQKYLDKMYEIKRQADHGELSPLTKEEAMEIGADSRKKARELRKGEAA